jgi:ribosomal protein L10
MYIAELIKAGKNWIKSLFKKKVKPMGFYKPPPGQHLFELNVKTKIITIIMPGKVQIKDFCLYTYALNLKSAERKFINILKNVEANKRRKPSKDVHK